MIRKIVLICFLMLFLNNCGYTPIYSKKNYNFEINKIEFIGNIKVNKLLSNKFKIYQNNSSARNSYDIILNSALKKTTITKDKKGNATQFSKNISINIKLIDSSNNQTTFEFSENSAYDNSNNKFDLRKYEDNLIKNMSEKIFSEIILFIQTKN